MQKIPLTQGKFAIVDDEDYENLMKWKWCLSYAKNKPFYARRADYTSGKYKGVRMHRVILDAKKWQIIDHINHDTLDNRKTNLRIVTYAENAMNRRCRKNCSSKYKGVTWNAKNNIWTARIYHNGKCYYLGSYKNEYEAAIRYNHAAEKIFCEFAHFNVI